MTRIAPSDRLVTLVNVFRLRDPADQHRRLDLLVDATETAMRHQPGAARS